MLDMPKSAHVVVGMQAQLRAGSQARHRCVMPDASCQAQCLTLRPGLQAQVADLKADCQSLRKEIAERADIIQDDFQTMRQQRQDVLQLEKQLFVTEHRKQVQRMPVRGVATRSVLPGS